MEAIIIIYTPKPIDILEREEIRKKHPNVMLLIVVDPSCPTMESEVNFNPYYKPTL